MSTGKFIMYKHGDYSFMCRSWATTRAWGHEVFLMRDNYGEVGEYKVRYYNRTWEAYQYQSAMFGAIEDYEKAELARYLSNRKIELGLKGWDKDEGEYDKPWLRGMKEEAIAEFKKTDTYKTIKELKAYVRDRN